MWSKTVAGALIATGAATVGVGAGLLYVSRKRNEPCPVPKWFPGSDETKAAFQDAHEKLYRQKKPEQTYTGRY